MVTEDSQYDKHQTNICVVPKCSRIDDAATANDQLPTSCRQLLTSCGVLWHEPTAASLVEGLRRCLQSLRIGKICKTEFATFLIWLLK